MGHYHRIVNLTQHKVITPMDAGALDKLREFGQDSGTAMAALWLLLGREAWCGDRIAILGYEGMDRGELFDPARLGDCRDLHLAAATGGRGGVTTALTAVLAASNRGAEGVEATSAAATHLSDPGRGTTSEELAERMELTQPTISALEAGDLDRSGLATLKA